MSTSTSGDTSTTSTKSSSTSSSSTTKQNRGNAKVNRKSNQLINPPETRPLIRRISQEPGINRIIRVIDGENGVGAARMGFNQQTPCYPPPPPFLFPPPPPPGFCPPFLFPPMLPLPPCHRMCRPPNPCTNVKPPCGVAQEKPKGPEPTPHFNNCNFYVSSDPFRSNLPPYLTPGLLQNPLMPSIAAVAPPMPCYPEFTSIPSPKILHKPVSIKCELPSESDICIARTENRKTSNARKLRTPKKCYEVSCQATARVSRPMVRKSTKSKTSSSSSDSSYKEKIKDPCRNQTIRIQPVKDPVPPARFCCPTSNHPKLNSACPIQPVKDPVPPARSCCPTSNHPKFNSACPKCIERYIEKQVALRLEKKCCCSAVPNDCPPPRPCVEEQCVKNINITIEPQKICRYDSPRSTRESTCCSDVDSVLPLVPKSTISVLVESKTYLNVPTEASRTVRISNTAATIASMATLTIFGPELHPASSQVIEFPEKASVEVSVSMPDLIVSHKSYINATTSNIAIRSEVEVSQIKSMDRCAVLAPAPDLQLNPCIPRKSRQHRICRPSYSRIRGMVVKNTSDKCVRRKHITVFKEHVPHETIQNSEVSCCDESPFMCGDENPTETVNIVDSKIVTNFQTPGFGNVLIDIAHQSQPILPVSSERTCCNKDQTSVPNVHIVAHSSKTTSINLMAGTGCTNNINSLLDKNTHANETTVHDLQRGNVCPFDDLGTQGVVKSWHWNTAHATTDGELFEMGINSASNANHQSEALRHSSIGRRGTKRRLSGYKI